MHGVWPFLAFLIAYGLFLVASVMMARWAQRIPLSGIPYRQTEIAVLFSLVCFFGFIYLLSGFWNARLVVIMLIAVHLGPLAGWFLTNAFGKNSALAHARQFWWGMEMGMKSPGLFTLPTYLALFGGLIYPIVAGIFYFRHARGSPVLQELEIKCTLILLTLCGQSSVSFMIPEMLASESLDEDTRQNVFFSQLGAMIPTAVYCAIGAAAFGFDEKSVRFDVWGSGMGRTISLQLLAIVFVFFAITALVPYLVGAKRARIREIGLLEGNRAIVAEIEDTLEMPLGALCVPKLEDARERITAQHQRLLEQETILATYQKFLENTEQLSGTQLSLKEAMDRTGSFDPRWRFAEDLTRLQIELREIIDNLRQQNPTEVGPAAEKWAKRYVNRKSDLKQQIDELASKKPIVAAGLGSGIMIILSGILGEVAKTAWGLISPGH